MRTVRSDTIALLAALAIAAASCGDDDGGGGGGGDAGRDIDGGGERDGGAARRDGGPRPEDGGTFTGLTLMLERRTPEQIGLYLAAGATPPEGSAVTVRYKDVADADWRVAHPLLRLRPEWTTEGAPEPVVDGFAGSIFNLAPGISYDVELTLTVPGMPDEIITTVATTRALPPPAGVPTVTATPSDDLQSVFDALGPGDVLELADGTYDATDLHLDAAGSDAMPIYVRGASREGVVLASNERVLQLQGASHVVFENLTMQGSGVDSGTNAELGGRLVLGWRAAGGRDVPAARHPRRRHGDRGAR